MVLIPRVREQASTLTEPTQDLVANQRPTVAGVLDQACLWGPRFARAMRPVRWDRKPAGSQCGHSESAPPKSCPPGADSSRTMQGRSEGGRQEVQPAASVRPWSCSSSQVRFCGSVGSCWCQGRQWPARLAIPRTFRKLRRRDFGRSDQRSTQEFTGAVRVLLWVYSGGWGRVGATPVVWNRTL